MPSIPPKSDLAWNPFQRQGTWEFALLLLVFFLQGADPVPGINEAHYLAKTIHYWNPDWIANDPFLDSADSHHVFYFTLGWLSMFVSPTALAWIGRLITWAGLAWGWMWLSRAVVDRPWVSILSATLWLVLMRHCHLAGEWVVGGVEAKGFAYVLVLAALGAIARNRWNGAWLLLGAASAFHVLVGGWSVVAAGVAWWTAGHEHRPSLRSMLPYLLAGGLLSLPGLISGLMLTQGVAPEVAAQANEIYVFGRLPHHLAPFTFPWPFVARFLGLAFAWALLERIVPTDGPARRIRGFVVGAMAIAAVGLGVAWLESIDRALTASLLRFYWFRLSDTILPLGAALVGLRAAMALPVARPWMVRAALMALLAVAGYQVVDRGWARLDRTPASTDLPELAREIAWREACEWVANQVSPDDRFLTPRMNKTFKWRARHSEVITWKDVPQDAASLVAWWQCMHDVHARSTTADNRWVGTLAKMPESRLRQIGRKYNARYLLTTRWPRTLHFPVVYYNEHYIIYRIDSP